MTIPALPTAPAPTDTPSEFNTNAFTFLAALDPWADAADALAVTVTADAVAADASASTASAQATVATDQAIIATAQAGIATTKAGEASGSAAAALVSEQNAAATYDAFDDRYLGSKSSNPTLDNDGNALLTGALYWNSSASEMRVWDGAVWIATYLPASGYVTLTGTETLTNKTIDYANNTLTGVAGVTATQTLTNKTLTAAIIDGGYSEEVFALGTSGSLALDPANGSIQTCALTGNPTFTDSLAAGESIVLMLTNGSSYTVTFPTITWVSSGGNVAPTLTASDVVVMWKVSTTLYGAWVGSGV